MPRAAGTILEPPVFVLGVEEDNNILTYREEDHEDDVRDLIVDIMYDVDDSQLMNLKVSERKRT